MRCSRKLAGVLAVAALAALLVATSALAFNPSGQRWPLGTVSMQLQLGPASTPLLDGAASWGAVAEDALATWNRNLANLQFTVVRDSPAPVGAGNGVNNVFWSQTVYGDAWDGHTLAITVLRYDPQTSRYTEADVLFNSTVAWDSYRGPLRQAAGGATLNEFRRVALHEFGHALGLSHPDDIGQKVDAVMNSASSDTDTLAADDIAGGHAIYDSATSVPLSFVRIGAGSAGWATNGSTLTLTADSIENVGEAVSGALKLELWAMPQHYQNNNALPSGSRRLGEYEFPAKLAPNEKLTKVNVSTAYLRPPEGSYYVVIVLTEFTGGSGSGYTIRDAIEFSAPLNIGTPSAPVITAQPANLAVPVGGGGTFTVGASGALPLTYQWRKNGTAIDAATGATLTLSNVQPSDAGTYAVNIRNGLGEVTSAPATLSISNPADPGRIINLSILTSLAAGNDEFTMGYVVGGAGTSGAKPLVIRAAGPSLGAAPFNLAGALEDPKMELYAGNTKTLENNDWGGGTALATAMAELGAFPFAGAGSKDSAVALELPSTNGAPSGNSVKVGSNTATGGVVLAEVYDATPSSKFTTTTPRLINVSVLKPFGTGFTIGFVIRGSASKAVLVRAIGPGLAVVGVTAGFVADPQLTLFNGRAEPIDSNNNWGGTVALSSAFAGVGAFPLPANSTDAALLKLLEPGSYTVEVKPAAGTASGLGLVEVYEVP